MRTVQRARILLLCAQGLPHQDIAQRVGVRPNTVSTWIGRWIEPSTAGVAERLADAPRSGAPPKFSPEEICQIIALACEQPCDHERPVTHWTVKELRDQAVQEQIVSEISERQVRRILHEADLQPHRVRYWLNGKIDPEKEQKIQSICGVYEQAAAAAAQGEVTFSVDENTGIQALQRIAPDRPMKPGRVQEIEFEYKRHGTIGLLAGLEVATGKIEGRCEPTRTEKDFVVLIDHLIQSRPGATKYHFVVDNLNTHISESLVRYVAQHDGQDQDLLGKKGKKGILKNQKTRLEFLTNPSHSIRFYYTPKHASWMNQIEWWFGVLARKVIRRGNFSSLEDWKSKMIEFIDYFNRTMAKPMKWIYTGKPAPAH